jgi:hypothetical protein
MVVINKLEVPPEFSGPAILGIAYVSQESEIKRGEVKYHDTGHG